MIFGHARVSPPPIGSCNRRPTRYKSTVALRWLRKKLSWSKRFLLFRVFRSRYARGRALRLETRPVGPFSKRFGCVGRRFSAMGHLLREPTRPPGQHHGLGPVHVQPVRFTGWVRVRLHSRVGQSRPWSRSCPPPAGRPAGPRGSSEGFFRGGPGQGPTG